MVVVGAGVGRKLGNSLGLLGFKSEPKVFLLPNFNLSLKANFLELDEVVSGGVTSVEPLLMVVEVSVVVVVGVVLIILKDKSLGCNAPKRLLLKGNLKPLGNPLGNSNLGILGFFFSSITFSNNGSSVVVVKSTTLIDAFSSSDALMSDAV